MLLFLTHGAACPRGCDDTAVPQVRTRFAEASSIAARTRFAKSLSPSSDRWRKDWRHLTLLSVNTRAAEGGRGRLEADNP